MNHYVKKNIDLSAYSVYQVIQFHGVEIDPEQRGIYVVRSVTKHLPLIYLKSVDLKLRKTLNTLKNILIKEQY